MSVEAAVSLVTNLPEVVARMKAMPRRQLPFAVALSLTRIAYEIRDAEREQLRKNFKIRSQWVVRQLTADLTRKSEWPNPSAKVGEKYSPLEIQETGGKKLPGVGSGYVWIPTRIVEAQRGSNGALPMSLRPRTLLANDLVRTATLPGMGLVAILKAPAGSTAFSASSGRGLGKAAAQRLSSVGFVGGARRALFLLRPSATIRPRFGFVERAERVVADRYADVLVTAMQYALATAR